MLYFISYHQYFFLTNISIFRSCSLFNFCSTFFSNFQVHPSIRLGWSAKSCWKSWSWKSCWCFDWTSMFFHVLMLLLLLLLSWLHYKQKIILNCSCLNIRLDYLLKTKIMLKEKASYWELNVLNSPSNSTRYLSFIHRSLFYLMVLVFDFKFNLIFFIGMQSLARRS